MNRLTRAARLALLLLSAVAGLAGAAPAPSADADLTELEIDQLVSVSVRSASKFEQKSSEAPSAVTVVGSEEIRRFGYRTLAEILDGATGFFTTYDRNYAAIGVRGFAPPGDLSTRILLLVDGHRINDGIFESAAAGTEFVLEVDLVDRVEIVRGPSSSLYGSNAFFGVVNVITRKPASVAGVELSGEAGSAGMWKGRASAGGESASGVGALASATVYRHEGEVLRFPEFDAPESNGGISERHDGDRYESFLATVARGGVTFQAAGVSRGKEVPTGAYGTVFNDARNKTVDTRCYADLKVEKSPDPATELSGRLYFDWYEYRGDYVFRDAAINPAPPNDYVNRDTAKSGWLGGEVTAIRKLSSSHRITGGAEARDYFRQEQRNRNEAPGEGLLLDERHSTGIWAAYLQDEFELARGLVLNLGVRYDHYSSFGGTTHPRCALIWNPVDGSTLKLLYGSAFRAPTQYESFYNDGNLTQKANPGIRPERIRTFELVGEQRLGEHFRFSASGYRYDLTGLIGQEVDPADGLLVYRNGGDIRATGLEVEAGARWEGGWSGRASYTVQSREERSGRPLANAPRTSAKVALAAPLLPGRVFLGTEGRYLGSRRSLAGNVAGGYTVVDATLLGRLPERRLECSAGVYNLFGREYGDPTGNKLPEDILRRDGRSFRAKMTYAF
jgi:iron complex outermembrane receptor protein